MPTFSIYRPVVVISAYSLYVVPPVMYFQNRISAFFSSRGVEAIISCAEQYELKFSHERIAVLSCFAINCTRSWPPSQSIRRACHSSWGRMHEGFYRDMQTTLAKPCPAHAFIYHDPTMLAGIVDRKLQQLLAFEAIQFIMRQ